MLTESQANQLVGEVMLMCDARAVGKFMKKRLKVPKAPNSGRTDGEWVFDETIIGVLLGLSNACKGLYPGMFRFDVAQVYMRGDTALTPVVDWTRLRRDLVVLVSDDQKRHFSVVLVEHETRVATLVDTLFARTNPEAAHYVRRLLPKMHLTTVQNKTRCVRQKGCTCGAWALWLACAFVLNVNSCRRSGSFKPEELAGTDPVAFWRAVTQ